MADTQSILQLGIEAARSGDKAEARELFRLVTREDPNNSQGWLWLAGVAEDREEKRAALERVVQIEPGNELARKGLAALGGVRAAPAPPTPDTSATTPIQAIDAGRVPPAPERTADEELADSFDSIDDYAAAPESGRARVYDQPSAGDYVPPDFGDDDYDLSEYQNRPRVTAADLDQPDQDRDTVVVVDDDDRRRRSGIGAWLPLLLALLFLAVLAFFLLRTLNNGGNTVADNGASASALPAGGAIDPSTAAGASGAAASGAATSSDAAGLVASPGAETSGAAVASPGGETGASAAPAVSDAAVPAPSDAAASTAPAPSDAAASTAPAPSEAPASATPAPAPSDAAASTAPAPGDVASANPAIVGNEQVLTAGAWEFGYSGLNNVATGTYGGALPSRGRYLIVLATARNTSGAPAQIPDGFFVLKDAQGRVYDFNRAASVDYINRFGGTGPGGAGDYAADTQIPPNAPLGSVPLLFDVAPDATNLVLFSRENTGQGFLVRQSAQ